MERLLSLADPPLDRRGNRWCKEERLLVAQRADWQRRLQIVHTTDDGIRALAEDQTCEGRWASEPRVAVHEEGLLGHWSHCRIQVWDGHQVKERPHHIPLVVLPVRQTSMVLPWAGTPCIVCYQFWHQRRSRKAIVSWLRNLTQCRPRGWSIKGIASGHPRWVKSRWYQFRWVTTALREQADAQKTTATEASKVSAQKPPSDLNRRTDGELWGNRQSRDANLHDRGPYSSAQGESRSSSTKAGWWSPENPKHGLP